MIERCIDCDKPLPACSCSNRLRCSCGIPDEACRCAGAPVPTDDHSGDVEVAR